MKIYVDTGRDEVDRMAESVLKDFSNASGLLAICRYDRKIPADATHAVVVYESPDYLTSSAHSAHAERFAGAYGSVRYPISIPELVRIVREITRVENAPADSFTFDCETRTVSKNGTSVILSEKESITVTAAVFAIKKPPNFLNPIIRIGIFSTKSIIPLGIFRR